MSQDHQPLLLLLSATEPPQATWLRFRGSRPLSAIKWSAVNFDPDHTEKGLDRRPPSSNNLECLGHFCFGQGWTWGRRRGSGETAIYLDSGVRICSDAAIWMLSVPPEEPLSLLAIGNWVINIQRARRLGASISIAAATNYKISRTLGGTRPTWLADR
jgi:hypothetical protein